MQCRPNAGFATYKPGYYSTDCMLGKGDYSKSGKCTPLTKAYAGCLINNECLTKTCQYTLAQGKLDRCSSKPNGCACMPPGGFKRGTPTYYPKYCSSKKNDWERRRRGPG